MNSVYLHLAKVEAVAQVVSVDGADADVAGGRHHALHRHRGHGRVGGGPAEVPAAPRRLNGDGGGDTGENGEERSTVVPYS